MARPPVVRQGIRRVPRDGALRRKPLTSRHLAVLGELSEEPTRVMVIATTLGMSYGSALNALIILRNRDLVRKIDGAWVRSAEAT